MQINAIDEVAGNKIRESLLELSHIQEEPTSLYHYTSAENAIKILLSKSLWLRSAVVMNDFSELEYGSDLVQEALNSQGTHLEDALGPHFAGLTDLLRADKVDPDSLRKHFTYSVSFADNESSSGHGLLSMWRAYGGGKSAVAIVFDYKILKGLLNDRYRLFPMTYLNHNDMNRRFFGLINTIKSRPALFSNASPDHIIETIRECLRDLVSHAKHPSFSEEKEYRISRYLNTGDEITSFPGRIETIAGIPQAIIEFDLDFLPQHRKEYIIPEYLLKQIIIGPTPYVRQVMYALTHILARNKIVPDAINRVTSADIPLRQ